MSKTLSTGTLGLRFMQNAYRRQQLEQVELQRAEVKDESRWEVGQEIKDAWGIGKESRKDDSIEYESSYLPFLFPSERPDIPDHSRKPPGRRVFNKKGEEISQTPVQNHVLGDPNSIHGALIETCLQTTDDLEGDDDIEVGELAPESSASAPNSEKFLTKGRKFKVHAKPKSISSLSGRNLKGLETPDQPEKESSKSFQIASHKSAREAIFDSLKGVGKDLRPSKHTLERDEPEGTKGFLKPSGIDAPAPRKPAPDSPSKSPRPRIPGIIEGARKKRPRDSGEASGGNKKRSKKSRSTADGEAPVPS